jgi:hypothetical protein
VKGDAAVGLDVPIESVARGGLLSMVRNRDDDTFAAPKLLMRVAIYLLAAWFTAANAVFAYLVMFAAQGGRYTPQMAHAMEVKVELLEQEIHWMISEMRETREEDKRLQLQIDRLEGHDPDSYTEDR